MTNEDTTTASVAMPASDYPKTGATWRLFNVKPDVFRRFETGRNKFERWSKYLDLTDETHKEIFDYAKKNNGKKTIILQCSDTGAMRSIRKRASNE